MKKIEEGWWVRKTTHGWSDTAHKIASRADTGTIVYGSTICSANALGLVQPRGKGPTKECRECKRIMAKLISEKLKGEKPLRGVDAQWMRESMEALTGKNLTTGGEADKWTQLIKFYE